MKALALYELGAGPEPVAWIVRDEDRARCKLPPGSPPAVQHLVARAARVEPRRVIRERTADGNVVLRREVVEWADPAWERAWADAVTYSELAAGRYVARTSSDERAARAAKSGAPRAFAAGPALVTCFCGVRYPVFAPHCGGCGGADPLGSSVSARELEELFSSRIGRILPERLLASVVELRAVLERHRAALEQPPPDTAGESPGDAARATLTDLRGRVAIPGLRGERLRGLFDEIRRGPDHVRATAASQVAIARGAWHGGAGGPEAPLDGIGLLSEHWRAVAPQLRAVVEAQQQALLHLGPVHRVLKKASDATVLGKAMRLGLTAFSAVKTMGASLVVKGALHFFNEHKQAKSLARLRQALDRLRDELARSVKVLDVAVAGEHELEHQRARVAAQHIVRALEADYAADPGQQLAIAGSAAQLVGRSPPGHDDRRPRPALYVRQHRRALAVLMAVAFAAVVALLMLIE